MTSLFQSFICRDKRFPSRLVLAPINTGFVHNGVPTERLIRFHTERSSRDIGLSLVGNVAVSRFGRTNANTAVLETAGSVSHFAKLALSISSHGSLAGVQLANSPASLAPKRGWRVSHIATEVSRLRGIVSSFSAGELEIYLKQFTDSALFAREAGFDVIQIHAAHGYLLALLLHPLTNARRDEYSIDLGWLEQFITSLRHVLGASLLSVRLSVLTGSLDNDQEVAWTQHLMRELVRHGTDLIDLSAGFYTIDRRLIYPNRNWTGPVYSPWLDQLLRTVSCPVTIAGRITNVSATGETLPQHALIGMGRALIADPELPTKVREGAQQSVRHCRLTNRCHYFSRGKKSLECGVNADL